MLPSKPCAATSLADMTSTRVYRGELSYRERDYYMFLSTLAVLQDKNFCLKDKLMKQLFTTTGGSVDANTGLCQNKLIRTITDQYNAQSRDKTKNGFGAKFYTFAYLPTVSSQKGNFMLLARCPFFIDLFKLTEEGKRSALSHCQQLASDPIRKFQYVPVVDPNVGDERLKVWCDWCDDFKGGDYEGKHQAFWEKAYLEEVLIPDIAQRLVCPNEPMLSHLRGRAQQVLAQYLEGEPKKKVDSFKLTDEKELDKRLDITHHLQFEDTKAKRKLPHYKNSAPKNGGAADNQITIHEQLCYFVACIKDNESHWLEDTKGKYRKKTSQDYYVNEYLEKISRLMCIDPNEANTEITKLIDNMPTLFRMASSGSVAGLIDESGSAFFFGSTRTQVKDECSQLETYLKGYDKAVTTDLVSILAVPVLAHWQFLNVRHSRLDMQLQLLLLKELLKRKQNAKGRNLLESATLFDVYDSNISRIEKFEPYYCPLTGGVTRVHRHMMGIYTQAVEMGCKRGKRASNTGAPSIPDIRTKLILKLPSSEHNFRTLGGDRALEKADRNVCIMDVTKYSGSLGFYGAAPQTLLRARIAEMLAESRVWNNEVMLGSESFNGYGNSQPCLRPQYITHTKFTDIGKIVYVTDAKSGTISLLSNKWTLTTSGKKSHGRRGKKQAGQRGMQRLSSQLDIRFALRNGLLPNEWNFSNYLYNFREIVYKVLQKESEPLGNMHMQLSCDMEGKLPSVYIEPSTMKTYVDKVGTNIRKFDKSKFRINKGYVSGEVLAQFEKKVTTPIENILLKQQSPNSGYIMTAILLFSKKENILHELKIGTINSAFKRLNLRRNVKNGFKPNKTYSKQEMQELLNSQMKNYNQKGTYVNGVFYSDSDDDSDSDSNSDVKGDRGVGIIVSNQRNDSSSSSDEE